MQNLLKVILKLFTFLIITLLIGCTQTTVSDDDNDKKEEADLNGKIIVNLTNAGTVADGTDCYIGIFNVGDDPQVDPAVERLTSIVNSGTSSATSTQTFTAGNSYDIWIFVDLDDDANPANPQPDSGDKRNLTAYNIIINGTITKTIDYSELVTF